MSLNTNGIESMEQYQPEMSCYSESYQQIQKQHYLPDTSTTEPPEYEAVSSTSHLNMNMGLDSCCRFVSSESDPNAYTIVQNDDGCLSQNRVGDNEDNHKPRALVRPTITREFVSATGEKFVLSHLAQLPNNRGLNEGIKKRKRTRTAFTDTHIKKLEDEYAANRYLDQPRRQYIAKSLNLLERTVKIWFQNRRMKEKKMIREANEQSGDEDTMRWNLRREFFSGDYTSFKISNNSYEVPQMVNTATPNSSYGYGMCPPSYNEAVSFYSQNSQFYPGTLPNIVNMGYNGQTISDFEKALPGVSGYSNQNESLRAAMSTLKVEDIDGTSDIVIKKHSPKPFLKNEEWSNEVTCSEIVDNVIPDSDISTNDYDDLDTFLQ